jgi:D-alanine-D-alanine ligase
MQRIVIAHNRVTDESSPDERDVLDQVAVVSEALNQLGYESQPVACDLNLDELRQTLLQIKPHLVFNLVESLAGEGRLIHLVPGLLDAMAIPYSGCPAAAIYLTSHKGLAKRHLLAEHMPTPPWIGPYPADLSTHAGHQACARRQPETRWIIKSVWEHASIGMDADSLVTTPDPDRQLPPLLAERAARLGGAWFAEEFIDGREFNLSILTGPDHPRVLPPAEIRFEGFDESLRPRIVDYRAKWDPDSYEYHHTPRCFDFAEADAPLLERLKAAALKCWRIFGLEGYARVDFRVDAEGRFWILEINTNPCLAPDAGFAAALAQAGLTFDQAIAPIVQRPLNGTVRSAQNLAPSEPSATITELPFRYEAIQTDGDHIRRIVTATGFFSAAEIDVAVELVVARLNQGDASGYHFVFLESEAGLIGYTCYGPIPCTVSSFDIYWIAVQPDAQKKGIGRALLRETERLIQAAGGTRIYVETSQRPQYDRTRIFYERCGYGCAAFLEDFYDHNDGKVVYCKKLA